MIVLPPRTRSPFSTRARLPSGSTVKYAGQVVSELGRRPQMLFGLILLSMTISRFFSFKFIQAMHRQGIGNRNVLIYGTGFQADQFLTTTKVFGRNGRELVSEWGGNPSAYKGVVVPDFPNFYCLYGPNTNIVVGSSIVFMVECQMRYVSGCLKLQIETGWRALECKPEVLQEYVSRIDSLNLRRAWGDPGVHSWYKNAEGRVTQNWPGTHYEFWQQTREPDPHDFTGIAN